MPVLSLNTIMSQYKIAFGVQTTVAAADTIATGLKTVLGAVATLQDDLVDDPSWVSAALAAAAGSIIIKTWKNTAGTDPTPLAATTFSKKVNWMAFGW